jgi:hypothetical protein
LDKKIINRPYNLEEYSNDQSKEIYETLNKKEKERIMAISNIDCEIYETPSLFCNIE